MSDRVRGCSFAVLQSALMSLWRDFGSETILKFERRTCLNLENNWHSVRIAGL